jgi:hypothetical protein
MDALDPILLARLQFAANITFHILFPTISIAMGWFLLFFKTRFIATGEQEISRIQLPSEWDLACKQAKLSLWKTSLLSKTAQWFQQPIQAGKWTLLQVR